MLKISGNSKSNPLYKLYPDMLITVLALSAIITLDNTQASLKYLGLFLILISSYLVFKVRFNSELLILFGLLTYVNFSVSLGDLLQIGQVLSPESLSWQMEVRLSEYNVIGAKCLLLVMTILNLFINKLYLSKITTKATSPVVKKDNLYIFYGGFLVLLTFWFFGYGSSMGATYESNTRTIYEYSLLVFIVVWFYSGGAKLRTYLLYFFAAIYIIQALVRGDRSSAFPMVVMLVLIHSYKINIKNLVLLAFSGIMASNLVSAYRIAFSLSELKTIFFDKYGLTAFLSDTVSQSYYTGISIVNTHHLIPSTINYFGDFLIGIFVGGSFKNADVGAVSLNYLINKGGGFYFSWFYFWFGFIGVILGSILLAYIIRKIFQGENNYFKLYKICLIVMAFRWYLYTPFVLFRSVIFVFTVLLITSFLIEKLTSKRIKSKYCELEKVNVEGV